MKRLFGKKSKKSLEPSPKHISLGIPANTAPGPLGFRAELDIGPDDERSNRGSRIAFQGNSGEDKELPVPEVSMSGVAVVGTGHRSDPTKNATDTGEGGGGGKPAEVSKGARSHHRVIRSLLTSTSPGERIQEHGVQGCHHSRRCPKGGHRWIQSSRFSQSRSEDHRRRSC
ncbi:hypothetical protein BDM02DRAFT_1857637 [Thelephora ganbajun]|uniref:Uncharacterized protein n=1 Tax=Thelephora ganbajun TaxID=370292 RepID=A0ACB6YZZ8_THEGA|nr:hypothetical protein BDM02DRAFT_1857637 [Thelephora ganbajun]